MFNLFKKKRNKTHVFTTEELEAMGLTVIKVNRVNTNRVNINRVKVNRVKPNYSSVDGRRA